LYCKSWDTLDSQCKRNERTNVFQNTFCETNWRPVFLVFFAVLLSVGLEAERVPPFIQDSLSYPLLAQAADAVTGEAREVGRSAAPAPPATGD
jgi:hypothetical protein